MNTAIKITQNRSATNLEPVLRKVLKEAEQQHRELQQMFELMGWAELPDRLKIEIKDDVSAMVRELEGQYSTCDPHILRRRKSVTYWVNCYLDGICSLNTAIEALAVKKL